jgi:hypothetical protein
VGCAADDGSDVGELDKGQRLKERGKAEEDGTYSAARTVKTTRTRRD